MQQPGARDLGSENHLERGGIEFKQGLRVNQTRCMNNSRDWSKTVLTILPQKRCELPFIGHVHRSRQHFGSLHFELSNGADLEGQSGSVSLIAPLLTGGELRPRKEDQLPGPMVDQPPGHFEPEISKPSRDQVACVGAPAKNPAPGRSILTFQSG